MIITPTVAAISVSSPRTSALPSSSSSPMPSSHDVLQRRDSTHPLSNVPSFLQSISTAQDNVGPNDTQDLQCHDDASSSDGTDNLAAPLCPRAGYHTLSVTNICPALPSVHTATPTPANTTKFLSSDCQDNRLSSSASSSSSITLSSSVTAPTICHHGLQHQHYCSKSFADQQCQQQQSQQQQPPPQQQQHSPGPFVIRLVRDDAHCLGRGRYSSVYKAVARVIPRTGDAMAAGTTTAADFACAVKVFNENDEDALELAIIEACALHRIQAFHPRDHHLLPIVLMLGLIDISSSDDRDSVELTPAATVTASGHAPQSLGGVVGNGAGTEESDHAVPEYPIRNFDEAAPTLLRKQGTWAVVLEYCGGGDSWSWIQAHKSDIGPDIFFQWSQQLASGMQALHAAGISHNDIKPHNILLTTPQSEEGEVTVWDNNYHYNCIRIADFTAAKFDPTCLHWLRYSYDFDPTLFISYSDHVGTIPHSAPEMLSICTSFPTLNSDHRHTEGNDCNGDYFNAGFDSVAFAASDVYSLGIAFYVLFVSAREPYQSIRSNMELLLRAKSGAFWTWEQEHYRQPQPKPLQRAQTVSNKVSIAHRRRQQQQQQEEGGVCLSATHSERSKDSVAMFDSVAIAGGSPANAEGKDQLQGRVLMPKSNSLNLGKLGRRWTYKPLSSRATEAAAAASGPCDNDSSKGRPRRLQQKQTSPAGQFVIHFLDSTEIPVPIANLIRQMVQPKLTERPTLDTVIRKLSEFESEMYYIDEENISPPN